MLLSLKSNTQIQKYLYKIVIVHTKLFPLYNQNSYLVGLSSVIANLRLILKGN